MSRSRSVEDAVFRAIADPTRRALLDALAEGDRPAGDLGRPFAISQPGLSQHLRVLREVGLVRERREGRRRIYRLNPRPLKRVHAWVAAYERFWRRRLDALEDYLEDNP
jgi:DNA-binding transcriptional ArsR family regulator